MTIAKRQKKRLEEQATTRLLTEGKRPTTEAVSKEMKKVTQGRTFGRPSLEYIAVEPNELSNPAKFNRELHQVSEDLEVAFAELSEQGDGVSRNLAAYETERKLTELAVKRVERRIERLTDRMSNPFSHNVLTENFHSFNQLSFKEDALQGIPKTTAHIDLDSGEARLAPIEAGSVKYDLSKAKVQVKSDKGVVTEMAQLDNLFSDTSNRSWKYRVTQEKMERVTVTLTLSLPEAVTASRLSIRGRMPKKAGVSLSLSADGQKWETHKEQLVDEQGEWQFDQLVRDIRLTFTKDEPDFTEGTQMHYYFSLLNISLRQEQYAAESYVVSRPLAIEKGVLDNVVLKADSVIYPGTDVEYYLGTEGGNFIEWQEIRPGVPMRMNQLAVRGEILDSGRTGYGELKVQSLGIDYYALGALTELPLSGRMRLYTGNYMWKVETRNVEGIDISHFPSLADWQEMRGVDVSYVGVEQTVQGKTTSLQAGSLQRFSLDLKAVRTEELYNMEMVQGTAAVQVYLNNEPLKPSATGRYTYRLKKGWNHLEVLTFSAEENPFAPNLYLRDVASVVLASKVPMTEVSEYHLTHNVPKRDHHQFALTENGPLINYEPKEKDATGEGVRFMAEYEYVPAGASASEEVRVMIKLTRSNERNCMTPVVKNYKIRLE